MEDYLPVNRFFSFFFIWTSVNLQIEIEQCLLCPLSPCVLYCGNTTLIHSGLTVCENYFGVFKKLLIQCSFSFIVLSVFTV